MSGTVYEFFGYRADDRSTLSIESARKKQCPFIGDTCLKTLNDGTIAGVCTVKPVTSGPVICCPIRLYADDYRIIRDVSDRAFEPGLTLAPGRQAISDAKRNGEKTVAVFGKRWGGELRLPQKDGKGGYFVDWVLALISEEGKLVEFVAIEVQTIDTTGNYHASRAGLLEPGRHIRKSSVGLNWENVSKRILPQLIYKSQVLSREDLCAKGLYFVCPEPVYQKILGRLGGETAVVRFNRPQPASITFMVYDHDRDAKITDGQTLPLRETRVYPTTVSALREAFNNVALPDENVYRSAIEVALELNQAPGQTFL